MEVLLGVLASLGVVSGSGFAVAYALAVRKAADLTVEVGDLEMSRAKLSDEIQSAREQKKRDARCIARLTAEVKRLESLRDEAVLALPPDRQNVVAGDMFDRMLKDAGAESPDAAKLSGGAAAGKATGDPAD